MAYTLWHFLIDGEDLVHPITRVLAEKISAGEIPETAARRDEHGLIRADVAVLLEDRVPAAVTQIWLAPKPLSEAAYGRPIAPIHPSIVPKLAEAIRQKLRKGRVQRIGVNIEDACSDLDERIRAGQFNGLVYADSIGMARQIMFSVGLDTPPDDLPSSRSRSHLKLS